MSIAVSARPVSHPLKAPFRISRGVKTPPRWWWSRSSTATDRARRERALRPLRRDGRQRARPAQPAAGARRDGEAADALALLTPGAARNALDCALWDLRAKRDRLSVAATTGLPRPDSLVTAVTVSLDTPEAMARGRPAVADAPLIKIKLSAEDPAARLRAVAKAAPNSRFIVDPNEGWTFRHPRRPEAAAGRPAIALVEQPCRPTQIRRWRATTRRSDLRRRVGAHRRRPGRPARPLPAVNLKLDKSGGLTEACDAGGGRNRWASS
jgi:L-alanine-DL-glutamate epimerase-like enolase superfamily enzyme